VQIRRKLVALVAPFLIVPTVLVANATAANAAITAQCSQYNICEVVEDMGSGYCVASVGQTDASETYISNGNFALVGGADEFTGYSCKFVFQRNVNNTGWYNITSFSVSDNGPEALSPNEWNGAGYQARACLQFNWGSSLGALHCSPAVHL
jgi:hypothetical protein